MDPGVIKFIRGVMIEDEGKSEFETFAAKKTMTKEIDERYAEERAWCVDQAWYVLAAQMSSGDDYIVPESRQLFVELVAGALEYMYLDAKEVSEVCDDLRAQWSGGPNGPYTMGGMYMQGYIHGIYARPDILRREAPTTWADFLYNYEGEDYIEQQVQKLKEGL
jgi:hypothetical protein